MRAFYTDMGDAEARVLTFPAQEPRIRITFLDPFGNTQATTVSSTYSVRSGGTRGEARKQAIRAAAERYYASIGCKLLTMELITNYPVTL